MKSVITPIAGLYDIKYNTLGELKRAVDSAYNELGERRAALRTIECARKQWEATAKAYGWKYEQY